mmetsp:Transcript_24094/g.50056  ORF Transcript_24094/g.50056 Transcript_24094/m.50056 type:complete len:365 (+) Transcript_24094:136-1230(+)
MHNQRNEEHCSRFLWFRGFMRFQRRRDLTSHRGSSLDGRVEIFMVKKIIRSLIILSMPFLLMSIYTYIVTNRRTISTMTIINASIEKRVLTNTDHKTSRSHPQVYLRQSQPLPPQINGTLRLVFLSDTHGRHDQIPLPLPHGDVLFHLGDAAIRGNISDVKSLAKWLRENSFHKERIVIDGNHDQVLYNPHMDFMKEYDGVARVLKDEAVQIAEGKITVVGVSWKSCASEDYSAVSSNVKKLRNESQKGNIDIDLVLSHIHPYIKRGGNGWHGSRGLTEFVGDLNAPLHCFGHIHWTRGVRQTESGTTLVNCATTWNEPVVIDYDPCMRKVKMIHCPFPDEELENSILRNGYLKKWLNDNEDTA